MKNEEKAVELAKEYGIDFPEAHSSAYPLCYKSAMKMATWKDEQFIEFLEWIDNVYVLRRFSDGESINFKGLVEKFKLMQK